MDETPRTRLRIAVAGASGFVGRALVEALSAEHDVVALARNPPRSAETGSVEWRTTDFLSLLDAEKGLAGVDVAYYLVHSMMPSAQLTQGRFEDFDLVAADNFARSAKTNGVRQIIYLGGLVPNEGGLSTHLRSRLEVEETLAAHGTPVTALRAGLIVGPGGSSFVIVKRLVERLPAMLCPQWTQTQTQPVALTDVIALLRFCADDERCFRRSFDIGGPDILTYEEMMRRTGKILGRRLRVARFPFFTPGLSRLWVTLITGAPRALVGPLVQSLRHRMVARERTLQEMAGIPGVSFEAMVRSALDEEKARRLETRTAAPEPVAFVGGRRGPPQLDVSSIQRFPLPDGETATQIAKEYLRWLPRTFVSILRVETNGETECRFRLWPLKKPLLVLDYSKSRSTEDRALFYIRGGLLARIQGRGRLEFREVLNRKSLLVSVLEFRPSLPWFVYRVTQAVFHVLVMAAFGRHLSHRGRIPAGPRGSHSEV